MANKIRIVKYQARDLKLVLSNHINLFAWQFTRTNNTRLSSLPCEIFQGRVGFLVYSPFQFTLLSAHDSNKTYVS